MKRKVFITFLFFIVLLYSNNNFQDWVYGYKYFSFLNIKKLFGFGIAGILEIFIFITTVLFVSLNYNKYLFLINKKNIILLSIMFIISVISIFILNISYDSNVDYVIASFRYSARYLSPLFYFYTFSIVEWNIEDYKNFKRIMYNLFLIILLIGYFQWIILGYTIDHLSSIIENSHVFSTIMMVGIFYFTSNFFIRKEKKFLLYLTIVLVISLVASNDKATIISILVIIITILVFYIKKLKHFLFYVSSLLLLITFLLILYNSDFGDKYKKDLLGGLERTNTVLEFDTKDLIYTIPFFYGYSSIPKYYYELVYPIFIGVGPTNYGGSETSSKQLYKKIWVVTEYHFAGSDLFSFPSSDLIILFLEFGLIYAALFLFLIWKILKFTLKLFYISLSNETKILGLWFFQYLVFAFLISSIYFREGLSNSTLTIPMFSFCGLVNSLVLRKFL